MEAFFYPLLVAHLLGDFALQTDAMIAAKKKYGVMGVLPHVSVIAILTLLVLLPVLGSAWLYATVILVTHLIIDVSKVKLDAGVTSRWVSHGLFLLDQVLHISILWGVSQWAANQGIPAPFPSLPTLYWQGLVLLVLAAFVLGILFRVFVPVKWHNRWPGAVARAVAWGVTAGGWWWVAPLPVALGLGFFRLRDENVTYPMWLEGIAGGVIAILCGMAFRML